MMAGQTLLPGFGFISEGPRRQSLLPGYGFVNEIPTAITGTVAATLGTFTFAGIGREVMTGTASANLAPFAMSAAGTVTGGVPVDDTPRKYRLPSRVRVFTLPARSALAVGARRKIIVVQPKRIG